MNMNIKNLRLLLLVSAATLTACATTLANRTPIDIASNSVRRTDALSGMSEVLAPKVKAFSSRRSSVRGRVQLRTAGPFTDDEGSVYEGGAYLDVVLNYGSATPNPVEARIYDQAFWPGGEPALLAEFGATVLDCREDVRAIPQYQYTPIYGAWGYGHIHDDYCGHEYGRDGWGTGYGHYGRGHVHDDYCGHDIDHDSGSNTVIISPTTEPRPVSRPVSRPVLRPVPDGPRRPHVIRPDGVAPQPDGRGTDPDVRPRRPRRPIIDPIPQPRAEGRPSKRAVSRPRPDIAPTEPYSQPYNPATRPQPYSPPAAQSTPKAVSRPAPVSRPRPEPVYKPEPTYKPKPSISQPKYTPNPRTKPKARPRDKFRREMHYYPRDPYYGGSTDYVVRRSCDRQENLRIFIPRERLDAAEINGLILYLRPRGGQEEVLSLPPNYIRGFKLAAWSPQGPQLTIQGRPLEPQQAAQTQAQKQAQTQQVPEQSKPDPKKPIIASDN